MLSAKAKGSVLTVIYKQYNSACASCKDGPVDNSYASYCGIVEP